MFFVGVIMLVLMVEGCFNGINHGLPSRIRSQNFGLVELFYRTIRVIAPCFFFWVIVDWRYPLIGIFLYLLAYGIKKLTWRLSYGL